MVSSKPLIIWIAKHKPNNEPKFHKYDKFSGVGKSTKNELPRRRSG